MKIKQPFLFLIIICVALSGWGIYAMIQPSELKKATLFVFPSYQNNKVFDMSKGRYNYRYVFPKLKEMFLKHGYDLQTQDIHPMDQSDLIFIAWPYAPKPPIDKKEVSYLWLFESPLGIQKLINPETEKHFNKIFTYSRALASKNNKYVHLHDPYQFDPWDPTVQDIKTKKILVMQIANNMISGAKNLYNERRQVTRWFLENHPQDYVLYGQAYWGGFKNKLPDHLKPIFDDRYKGKIPSKKEAFKTAKFVLAYENTSYDDYVSEKILDVLNAGAIPVYLGAPNIREYVPEECFIDQNEFATYDALYDYLKNMPDEQYERYMTCIRNFVTRDKEHNMYDIDKAVQTIENTIFKKGFMDYLSQMIKQSLNSFRLLTTF